MLDYDSQSHVMLDRTSLIYIGKIRPVKTGCNLVQLQSEVKYKHGCDLFHFLKHYQCTQGLKQVERNSVIHPPSIV